MNSANMLDGLPPEIREIAIRLIGELPHMVPNLIGPPLRRFVDAGDIAQMASAEFCTKLDRFQSRSGNPEPELRKLLLIMATRKVQDAARQAERAAAAIEMKILHHPFRDGPAPTRVVGRAQAIAAMMEFMAKLDPESGHLIKLRYISGMTFEAIGHQLGIPTATAQRRHDKALANLRDMMGSSSHFSFGTGGQA